MPAWTGLPLFAQDIGDVIGIIVFIIIALISWAAQAMGNNKKKQAREQQRRRAAPAQPRQQPRVPQAGGGARRAGQGGLEDEIGEFLRDAARRRQGGPAGQAAPPPPQRPQPGLGRPISRQPQPGRAPAEPVLAAEVIEPAGEGSTGREDASRTGSVEQQAEQLSQQVEQARRESQRMLQQRFSRKAAKLGAAASAAPGMSQADVSITPGGGSVRMPAGTAAGIRRMLVRPLALRQAVVAAEVLNRPTQRWE